MTMSKLRIPTYGHGVLPYQWTRFVLSVLTLVFSIVAGALAVKILTMGKTEIRNIRHGLPAGATLKIDTSHLRHVDIVLIVANMLLSNGASNPVLFLLQDSFHIIPPTSSLYARLSRLPFKMRTPLSTTTLKMQAWSMLLGTLAMIGVMIPLTIVIRNDSAIVEGMSSEQLSALGVSVKYWDYTFVKNTAILPWIAILFAIPLTAVTFMALARAPAIPSASSAALNDSTPPSEEAGIVEKVPSSERV